MMRVPPALLLCFLGITAGCTEYELGDVVDQVGGDLGSISGRLCNTETQTWLAGALVYTNLFDEEDVLYDTRITRSDEEGWWELEDLPGETSYDIFVQYSGAIIENFGVKLDGGEELELDEPECFGSVAASVAVVSGDYDEFGSLLADMGISDPHMVNGLTGTEIVDFLSDSTNLAEFDAIFFNGGHIELGVITSDGSKSSDADVALVKENLSTYVKGGGMVIASDWAYDMVEQIWSDKIDFLGDDLLVDDAQQGEPDTVQASVPDADLAAYLGQENIDINLDMAVWPLVESVSQDTTVYLRADVDYRVGMDLYGLSNSPIMVSFSSGEGQVAFTAFRYSNSENSSGAARQTLQYLLEQIE